MRSTSIIRAVDIGYGNTKFIADNSGTCKLFPSLAPRANVHHQRAGLHYDRRTTQVLVDGCAFEVGPDTALFPDIPILHADYIEAPEFRALLYGALNAMQQPRIDLLVTGLPVHLHASRWRRLQELLVGTHIIQPDVTVEILQVAVVTQPLGGLIHYTLSNGNVIPPPDHTYLLIDPGFFTFDWLVTKGLHEVPGLSGSIECGVSEYANSIEENLNRQLGDAYSNSNLRRIDDGLRNGNFRLKGRVIDLKPLREHGELVVDRAMRALRNVVGTAHEIDEIVLVGGGGFLFADGLRKAFPNHAVHAVDDPVFANVRGFQLIGGMLHKGKNKKAAR